jgi:hypothetical protein
MSEAQPGQEIERLPSHRLITNIGYIDADWSNSTLVRFTDPYENYLEYNDGDSLQKLTVLDDDWEALSAKKFPWEYWPDLKSFSDNDMLEVDCGDVSYEFRPRDSKLRLFDDPKYNYVEHRTDPTTVVTVKVVPALWRMMFKGDFPIKYLPYVDRESLKRFGEIAE